jgi:hypothetical protein
MGVAEYRLSTALPEPLQAELPTVAEFAREFSRMSLVKLCLEVEREIHLLMNSESGSERPLGIGSMLNELQQLGLAPRSAARYRAALQTMNRAVHGFEVTEADATRAAKIATAFLAELRAIRYGRPS